MLLVPLLRESLLPGETRPVDALGIDRDLAAYLGTLPEGTEVCTVTIASAVEVPTLVAGRFATRAVIARPSARTGPTNAGENANENANATKAPSAKAPLRRPTKAAPTAPDPALPTELRGLGRLTIASAKIEAKRVVAEVLHVAEPERFSESLAAGAGILASLANGAAPESPLWKEKAVAVLAGLAHAVASPREQGALVASDLSSTLEGLASALEAHRPVRAAAQSLEGLVHALPPTTPESKPLPESDRRRLWAHVVEIQRKLDLYDVDTHVLGSDFARLMKRLSQAGLRDEAKAVTDRELRLLRGMEPSHHDYSTIFAHLDLFSRLPWHPSANANVDLARVRASLDASHAGLGRVKRRILEYLAVKQLGGTGASTILCLGGPPGVGKTTIAKAIADALGRPFIRIALGGVHDESEIRGHRRTFAAASAGRIVNGMTQSRTNDPVMLLDEIDKIGTDRGRSPQAALLEVLDPSQHTHFIDNFLSVPYDLSNVLFLCTANDIGRIDRVLRDRLEVVELEGYTLSEKVAIAEAHLLPGLAREHGIGRLTLPPELLTWLAERYTREAGVRELRRVLAQLYRDRALTRLEAGTNLLDASPSTTPTPEAPITQAYAEELLGPPRFRETPRARDLPVGVATGLATSVGQGSLLRIEVGTAPGKGAIVLTGSLGDVMRESVQTVLGLLRMNAEAFRIPRKLLKRDLYVHVPDAATPKDGPSAGCALFSAMLSAFSGRRVHADMAVTGELSLTGEVLAVGGVREKVIAAERAGMRAVIVPEDNRADVPKESRLEVVYVTRVDDLVRAYLTEEKDDAESPTAPA